MSVCARECVYSCAPVEMWEGLRGCGRTSCPCTSMWGCADTLGCVRRAWVCGTRVGRRVAVETWTDTGGGGSKGHLHVGRAQGRDGVGE